MIVNLSTACYLCGLSITQYNSYVVLWFQDEKVLRFDFLSRFEPNNAEPLQKRRQNDLHLKHGEVLSKAHSRSNSPARRVNRCWSFCLQPRRFVLTMVGKSLAQSAQGSVQVETDSEKPKYLLADEASTSSHTTWSSKEHVRDTIEHINKVTFTPFGRVICSSSRNGTSSFLTT